jgi:hypothetical protein
MQKKKNMQDVASAVLLAYSAKPFSIPEGQVQEQQSQQSQHVASILGGISMGLGACVCIAVAGKRMLEAVGDQGVMTPRRKRMRSLLGMSEVAVVDGGGGGAGSSGLGEDKQSQD